MCGTNTTHGHRARGDGQLGGRRGALGSTVCVCVCEGVHDRLSYTIISYTIINKAIRVCVQEIVVGLGVPRGRHMGFIGVHRRSMRGSINKGVHRSP